MTVEEFIARLDGVRRSDDGWQARCPAHDDRHASLSVAEGDDGRVLVRCHAGSGCSFEEIVRAAGVKSSDLFQPRDESSNGRRIVAHYDYEDEAGILLFQTVRFEPKGFSQRRPDGRGGWVWKLGSTRRVICRLPRVLEAVTAGRTIYVVEGEKDVGALEQVGEIATCNPMGAGKWRDSYSKALRGADVVIVQDRDDEGRKHAAKVAGALQGFAASVRIVEAARGKDAADHLAAGHSVDEFVRVEPDNPDTRTTNSEPAPLSEKVVREAPRTPPGLAYAEDILAELRVDLRRAGLAGERRGAEITYLALTSRLLPWGKPTNRPVSAIGRGTTSSGKSATQRAVLRFFPDEAYFDLGSMSKRFLVYSDEPLAHRFIVVPEWASIAKDDEIVASLRTLLSEGRLVHGTVDGDGKREARKIEKAGPTGLLMTTTSAHVDVELESRCLSFLTDDSPEQTRRVFQVLAELEDDDDLTVDFERWHDLQRWLASGQDRVVIPYVHALAALMPDGAPRLRRDFISVLCLTRAHAILHQATRERDGRGRIVAEIADYEAVHALLDDIVAEAVDASVSAATRETVEVVRALLDESEYVEHTSVKKIADQLAIGRSATYDRVRRALAAGFLTNIAKADERGLKITLGGELPAGGAFLPAPDDLVVRVVSGEATGRENLDVERGSPELSGSPVCPVGTRTDTCSHSEHVSEAQESARGIVTKLRNTALLAEQLEGEEWGAIGAGIGRAAFRLDSLTGRLA